MIAQSHQDRLQVTRQSANLPHAAPTQNGTGVRAEKRRGVSCEVTSTKAFPVGDQPQLLHLTLIWEPGSVIGSRENLEHIEDEVFQL